MTCRGAPSTQDIRDRRAGGPGPARRRLPRSALEDPGPDATGLEDGEPRHVRAVWEQLVVLDIRADRDQVEPRELALAVHRDRALWVAHVHVPEAPSPPGGRELTRAVAGPDG